jgi:hypothetical protein
VKNERTKKAPSGVWNNDLAVACDCSSRGNRGRRFWLLLPGIHRWRLPIVRFGIRAEGRQLELILYESALLRTARDADSFSTIDLCELTDE